MDNKYIIEKRVSEYIYSLAGNLEINCPPVREQAKNDIKKELEEEE